MGMNLTMVGHSEMFIKFKTIRNTKVLKVIVCEDEGNKILVVLEKLIEIQWIIIPKCFSLPMGPRRLMTYLRKWWISCHSTQHENIH